MNRQAHLANWDLMRMRHGITLRLAEQIPDDQLARHPITGMRTPIELLVHMYACLEGMAAGTHTGKCDAPDEKPIVAGLRTKKQLLEYLAKAWTAGDQEARTVSEVQLGAPVRTWWGDTYPAHAVFGVLYDEYQHHRGQLYAFVRTYGIEPVMVWDFEHNAPEFQPDQVAKG